MVSAKDFVTAGQTWQPPNASLFNAFVQTAITRERVNREPGRSTRAVQRVSIQIQSATDVVPGTVVGFGAPTNLVTAAGESRLDVIFGSGSIEQGKWAVAIDGISANAVGDCALTGVAWAEVDVVDDTHSWADAVGGVITSKTGGYAKILYKPVGTGVAWCCLHLGFDPRVGELETCLCALKTIVENNLTLDDPAETDALAAACGLCDDAPIPATDCFHCFEGDKPDTLLATITAIDNVQPDPFGVNWSGFLTGTHTLEKIASQLQCDRGNDGNEIDCGTITEQYGGSGFAIGSPARIRIQESTYSPAAGQGGASQLQVFFEIDNGGLGFWSSWEELHVNFIGLTIGEKLKSHQSNSPYDYAQTIGGTLPPVTSDMATITSCAVGP